MIQDLSQRDRVLDEPLLSLLEESAIVGLPQIGVRKLYILSVKESLSADGSASTLHLGGKHLLVHIDNGIQFL